MTSPSDLRVALVGNMDPPFSTENEYLDAWASAGATVEAYQEGNLTQLSTLLGLVNSSDKPDLIQWTRTLSLANRIDLQYWWEFLRMCGRRGVPVVGVHLDKWWGLKREHEVHGHPYFRGVDMLFTADGGYPFEWEAIGVNHRWLLPAISERWLGVGTPRPEWRSKVGFVGNWMPEGGYHREAKHRHELVAWLSATYGDDVQFWPRRGQHAIRGRDLNDLYASIDVVVGDSADLGRGFYVSDRIPETAGRGGVLCHPLVEGVTGIADPFGDVVYRWEKGDWRRLRDLIDECFEHPAPDAYRENLVRRIAAGHTYTDRVHEIVGTMRKAHLL
jgi:hypothetical protein